MKRKRDGRKWQVSSNLNMFRTKDQIDENIIEIITHTGCLKENTADKYGHTKRRYN